MKCYQWRYTLANTLRPLRKKPLQINDLQRLLVLGVDDAHI
jgi:hypothetical protein